MVRSYQHFRLCANDFCGGCIAIFWRAGIGYARPALKRPGYRATPPQGGLNGCTLWGQSWPVTSPRCGILIRMDTRPFPSIAAVIAAAGFSRRMGHFKQLLPWGDSTVIRTVFENLHGAGAEPILCVTGHRAVDVAAALEGSPACVVPNPDYASGEMLTSYQAGIGALLSSAFRIPHSALTGSLLALADQPHIPVDVIRRVVAQAQSTPEQIVMPSHRMRRGHPIFLPRRLWGDLLALPAEGSLRQLMNRHSAEIMYVDVETDAIRQDMDEWGEYERLREEFETQKREK